MMEEGCNTNVKEGGTSVVVVQRQKVWLCNAEDTVQIPGPGIKIPRAVEQWTLGTAITGAQAAQSASRELQPESPWAERSLSTAVATWHSHINKQLKIFLKNKKGKTKSPGA